MALGTKHVLSFSSNGKLFALINEQGILRIWDTETNQLKQEYTPNLHLLGPCTAITWVTLSEPEDKDATPKVSKNKKPRKSSTSKQEALYLALGTSKGQVSLYSYSEAKVLRELDGEGHAGKITGIVHNNEGIIYTCGLDQQIISWSLSEMKRKNSWPIGNDKPTSLSYLKDSNKLVLGCRQIKVFSLELGEIVQTFTGHASEVSVLQSFQIDSNEYVLSAAKMERVLSIWKIGKKGINKPATCNLLSEDVIVCVATRNTYEEQEEATILHVVAVTRNGVIHKYKVPFEKLKSEKPIKPEVTIEFASDSETVVEPIPAVAASFVHSFDINKILIAYGSSHFLVFEHFEPKLDEKIQVLIRKDPKKLGKTNTNKRVELDNKVVLKSVTPIVDPANVEYKSAVNLPKKKQQNELPMESRLKSLNLGKEASAPPQGQSKVQLLMQSLHGKDTNLLRSVLCTKDVNVIQSTLKKLPVEYVQFLVDELTSLMQMKRINIEYAILWLKTLSQTHSSQLLAMGLEDLTEKFGSCIGIIEHRLNCLSELSKFNGRLQLLVSQIKNNIEADSDDNEDVLVYQDEESDEEWYNLDESQKLSKSSSDKDYYSSSENEEDEDEEIDENPQNGNDSDSDMDENKSFHSKNQMDVSDADDDSPKLKIYNDEEME